MITITAIFNDPQFTFINIFKNQQVYLIFIFVKFGVRSYVNLRWFVFINIYFLCCSPGEVVNMEYQRVKARGEFDQSMELYIGPRYIMNIPVLVIS